ncbi:patatin-like phospholipase family protein [Chitinophaga oryzae]|uniref:Patatin-like phospholipase family protein n=1 Tax=Chitinophaga oryzae TaxID=2725414 RepID=A0AAE6ZNY5_9BACT|nr:patatin-like phospholipase family protein [Chitinophaga oryzae]QJB35488.1 patatin-like phospholipase family protein [Chitinophaga oryzae]QJB42031.1 patatin-like phospholipase family protein [Chitinophaga oryzae]
MPVLRPFVLSGGGARGYAHLGVLKAFSERQIFPEVISATSAGSIAAAFICDGFSTDEVREIFQQQKLGLSMEWKNWRAGFLSLKKVEEALKKNLRHTTFESLPLPLYVAATNFANGEQTIFNSGPLIPAILAASTIPMLFRPVEINGVPYVDGGLSGNLPVEPLLGKYAHVIGVHVNPLVPYNPAGGFLANMERTLHMAIREPVLKSRQQCEFFIEPEGLGKFGMFDFSKFDAIYTTGLDYTRKLLAAMTND